MVEHSLSLSKSRTIPKIRMSHSVTLPERKRSKAYTEAIMTDEWMNNIRKA